MSTLFVQLDMEEFCEVADLSAAYVIEIVEHGILAVSYTHLTLPTIYSV